MAVAHPLEPPADSAAMHAWQETCAALVRLEPGDRVSYPEPLRQAHHVSIPLRGTPRDAEPSGDDIHSPS
jgi:hypothetical protein